MARAKAIERVFSPSNPISDRALFAGRGAELQRVLAAVDAPGQHVVLFGERGVGKTSLANTIGALHGTRDRSPVVKIECSADLDAATLWRGLLSYLPAAGRPRVGFAGAARPESRLDLGDVEDLGPEQICRLLAEASRTGAPLLIIDEFDRINDPVVGRTLTDVMKAVSDRALPVTIMVVGVARNVETLLQEHASIVRCLVEVGMPRMSATELEEIVHPRLKRVQMNITPRALGWIVSLSQGFPHYTHVLAADAARVANEGFRDLITETDVDRAIQLAVERVQHSIAAAYERSVRSHRRENRYAEMLLASALAQVDQGRFFAPADLRQPLEAMGRRATLSSVGHPTPFARLTLSRHGARRSSRGRSVRPCRCRASRSNI